MIPLLAGSAELLWVLGAGYLGAGVAVAASMARRGDGAGAVLSAVPCWPLLMMPGPTDDAPRVERGPLAHRIDRAFEALLAALGATDPATQAELAALQGSVIAADRRIAQVDRLLADPALRQEAGDEALEPLRGARARTISEIECVLAEVVQWRVQAGLVALAGERAPVQDRLRALKSRITALEEITLLEAG